MEPLVGSAQSSGRDHGLQAGPLVGRLFRSAAFVHLHHQPSGCHPRGVRCEVDAVPGLHCKKSLSIPVRESLVSDTLPGDGKIVNLFYSVDA